MRVYCTSTLWCVTKLSGRKYHFSLSWDISLGQFLEITLGGNGLIVKKKRNYILNRRDLAYIRQFINYPLFIEKMFYFSAYFSLISVLKRK